MSKSAPRIRYAVNARAKRVSLRIDSARREVVATAPSPNAIPMAKAFVAERAHWITSRFADLPEPLPFVEGGRAPLRGICHRLVRVGDRGRPTITEASEPGEMPALAIPGSADAFAGRVKRFLKAEARSDFEAYVRLFAGRLDRPAGPVSIKDTSSRWGSCAYDGAIAFSWRLICAPAFVARYVAAHECAHLIERGHDRAFWGLVDTLVDDAEAAKAWLKAHGSSLFAVGADH